MELKDKPKRVLDGKTWLRYSISVWDDIEKSPEEKALHHPAMYPSALVERLLDCYLWHQGVVFDPFLGSGSTLVAALKKGHSGVGFEVVPEFCLLALERLKTVQPPNLFSDGSQPIIQFVKGREPLTFERGQQKLIVVQDDARNIEHYLQPETVDILITSPPYWVIHRRPRTADYKKPRPYSDLPNDLGNIERYVDFLEELGKVFAQALRTLKPEAYCIVNVMDLRHGSWFIPYHVDIISLLTRTGFALEDIIIWNRAREYNNLRPLGYPHKFIVNKVHEYLLVFRKPRRR
ncbi:MAG: DNA methyltransferase [Armatimonadota bacterium]